MPRLAAIVALGSNRCIGVENNLPWYLPEDLKHFKQTTLGKPVIMGRKTFESIGKPLPGRTNIVVTRNANWSAPGVRTVPSLARGIEMGLAQAEISGSEEAMVIGGADIYRQSMDQLERLYLTEVDAAPEGDAFFPELDDSWTERDRQSFDADGNKPAYAFVELDRRP